ncbi:MAG: hypothetical protein LBU65_09830 [Planctomycetaceae bacterium]|jgi:hypothetical protein|nr:hypothetical protein [Planctomycetaceae bacterium]
MSLSLLRCSGASLGNKSVAAVLISLAIIMLCSCSHSGGRADSDPLSKILYPPNRQEDLNASNRSNSKNKKGKEAESDGAGVARTRQSQIVPSADPIGGMQSMPMPNYQQNYVMNVPPQPYYQQQYQQQIPYPGQPMYSYQQPYAQPPVVAMNNSMTQGNHNAAMAAANNAYVLPVNTNIPVQMQQQQMPMPQMQPQAQPLQGQLQPAPVYYAPQNQPQPQPYNGQYPYYGNGNVSVPMNQPMISMPMQPSAPYGSMQPNVPMINPAVNPAMPPQNVQPQYDPARRTTFATGSDTNRNIVRLVSYQVEEDDGSQTAPSASDEKKK